MKRFIAPSILSACVVAAAWLVPGATAQQKSPLVGSWSFVSSTGKTPDGNPTWGANPKGLLIFAENGYYSSIIVRADVPKFASNNRLQGTPEENKAAVHGAIATFGKYTVDEANKSFTVRFEASTYPNNTGTEQTRPFVITGDELKISNPASSAGGQSELLYKRAK